MVQNNTNTSANEMLFQIVNFLTSQGQPASKDCTSPYVVSKRASPKSRNQPRSSKLRNNRPRSKYIAKHKDMPHFQRRN